MYFVLPGGFKGPATQIVSPGRASEAIASLPVAALRLADSVISSLHDVGIERVAQIASKPRAGLRLRFGGDVLLRFDQALGSAQEALTSLIPPEVPRTELRFAEPVADPEDLKRIIELLCEKLCVDLEARGIGARRLDLVFVRVDNITQAARIGLSRPLYVANCSANKHICRAARKTVSLYRPFGE
jgi:protein ImuB